MMWDFTGGQQDLQRSRSRSPQPPQMRMPSPSFPVPNTSGSSQNVVPYSGPMSSSYPPATPGYTPYISHEYPSIPRTVKHQPASPHYPQPQVIHVIHHSSHHSKHAHKHKSKHNHSHSSGQKPPSPMMPSASYQSAPAQLQSSHHQVHFNPSNTGATGALTANASSRPVVLHKPRPSGHHAPQSYPTAIHGHVPQMNIPHQLHMPSTSQAPEPLNPFFQYSKCTGRKRALCIGINYNNQPNELRGCVNDAKHVRDFLIKQGGYRSSEILLLTDEKGGDKRTFPTRATIIHAMKWLVKGACQDDSLFFHYSGHGGQTRDLDGDEVDGWDEVIYPVDFRKHGHIIDDEMHDLMVRPLPPGCRLTGLFDACHSGTVLDLPYIYSSHGRLKGSHISNRWIKKKATAADVISWSGCADGQTSADTFAGGVAVGAMSYAFITALKNKPHQSYQELLRSVRLILHPRFSQKPQLASSHHIDTNLRFVF